MSESEDKFDEVALAPKKSVGAEGSVTERDVDDLIKGERWKASRKVKRATHGLRISTRRGPDTV